MKNKKIKIFAKILFSLFVIAVMTAAVGIAILVGEGYYIYDRVTAQRGIEDIVQQIQVFYDKIFLNDTRLKNHHNDEKHHKRFFERESGSCQGIRRTSRHQKAQRRSDCRNK